MYEVFNQQAQGRFHWSDELELTPYYDSFALSPRRTTLCQVLTVGEAMELTLRISDNATAVLLQDLVGAPNVNASLTALGIKDSGLFSDGLPLTAQDVALLLEAISRGAAVSRDASSDMLQLMTYEELGNGLKEGLPDGVVVAHKTGNWSDATHDAGIVFAPFGPYLFVALAQASHETRYIQALSAAAYAYFENNR
jgi:beta-lactamase class A